MNVISHARNCILAATCTLADGPKCAPMCAPFVAAHGFDGVGGRAGAAKLPQEYRLCTLKDAPPRAEQAEVYAIVDEYVKTFERQFETGAPPIKSLYLYSAPGTGKTTTAAALLNEWLTVTLIGSFRRNRKPLDRPAYFLDVNGWQTQYNAFNRSMVPEETAKPAAARYYHAMDAASNAPFAVLDDIGVREATEAFRADLHAVVNARVAGGLPTVYTSNVPMANLVNVFDRRLADRIRDQCMELSFSGQSKRGFR